MFIACFRVHKYVCTGSTNTYVHVHTYMPTSTHVRPSVVKWRGTARRHARMLFVSTATSAGGVTAPAATSGLLMLGG